MSEPITPPQFDADRYERSKRIEWLDLAMVSRAKVIVVGAGALGNETCKNLVLSGYKHISLVDMDWVVRSNLNRCVFFTEADAEDKRLKVEVIADGLRDIAPEAELKVYPHRIEELPEALISEHDIVLGCLDNIAARLHVNALSYHHRIPYIDGATDGLRGKVHVLLPPSGPCLECYMNDTHYKALEKRFSCTGEATTYVAPRLAAEITTTSVVSAVQVREALKLACGRHDLVLNNVFYYDGTHNVADVLKLELDPECHLHIGRS